ncbi:uncharacterized protein N7459_007471 [Penicillium hispanicum]|uniref:uncharacterized protein n=1 Tax=Penicillium hispanicum TaxID=1080232 RepID=UPI002541307B|nr:uncharacterized protein N7459_007471 [Penicillium hispanicum]KAJ5578507.1 hypothetical protein N7459_007471 [Penicillium hispanicum]
MHGIRAVLMSVEGMKLSTIPPLGKLNTMRSPNWKKSTFLRALTLREGLMKSLGPFFSAEDYFRSHIQLILDWFIRQESYVRRLGRGCVFDPSFLPNNVSKACSQNHLDDGKFYLKHADGKGITDEFHWETWKADALEHYKSDRQLQQVIEMYK